MNKLNSLEYFLDVINDKILFKSIEERFSSLANCLMNYLCLTIGKNMYRITECEVYYFDIDHQDPYVHRGEQQLTAGKLYLNKVGGLDITFGNADIPIFAGILIRGIHNLKTNEYTNKVTEIVSELFNGLGNIITEKNGINLCELTLDQTKVKAPIQTTRVGLSKKEEDFDNYIEKPYRYIVDLSPAHKFRDKENVVKQYLNENKDLKKNIKEILGYNIKL